jgi:hypothetical protein
MGRTYLLWLQTLIQVLFMPLRNAALGQRSDPARWMVGRAPWLPKRATSISWKIPNKGLSVQLR